jgi:hypothetical protein
MGIIEILDAISLYSYDSNELKEVANRLRCKGFWVSAPPLNKDTNYLWSKVSKNAKEKANYTCEICGCNEKTKIIAHLMKH